MFSKFFAFFSLKRAFSSTEETDNSVNKGSDRPAKRVRIEEPSSTLEENNLQTTPVQDACTTEDDEKEEELDVCDEILPRGTKGKEAARLEELEEEVRETRAIAAHLAEETRNYVESIDRAMTCVICHDFIRNPQALVECGHTVCYRCLRSWFTRDTEDYNVAPMVSTDEESDDDDDGKNPESSKVTPRHRFHSAVDRKKVCPECSQIVTRRPRPIFRLRHLADILSGAEAPIPSILKPRGKLHKSSKRQDIWRGIFHAPGDDQNAPPAPAPVRNGERRERVRNWEDAMDEAREDGRRQMVRQLRRERNEERRRQPRNRAQDEPMGVAERIIRPLPLRRTFPTPAPNPLPSSSSQPMFGRTHSPPPFAFPSQFGSGPDAPPPRPPVFVLPTPPEAGPSNINRRPPPPEAGPSNINRPPSPPPSQRSSSPIILESLRRLRQQFASITENVDEVGHDADTESGDEDLPLFTAMMQAVHPPAPAYHRKYPVYIEELDLGEEGLPQPEGQPQLMMDVDIPVVIYLDDEEDEEGGADLE